jgi:hypothetical protein
LACAVLKYPVAGKLIAVLVVEEDAVAVAA